MGKENLTRIPGVIDTHVHFRDFGEDHKEDWWTGTRAAVSGGVITVVAMPNTKPPVVSNETLKTTRETARKKAACDWGVYYGASNENAGQDDESIVTQVLGLKMYLNSTHGTLLLEDSSLIERHLKSWPAERLVLVHAEDETILKVLEMVDRIRRPVHFCHISQAQEMVWIRLAKERGLPVTCEVTPHHLFLTEEDERVLGPFGKMKPPLRIARDIDALWKAINDGVVDTIGSDHAPHTLAEKRSENPPFGVPGVETTLPLLLTAVAEGRMSLERMVELTSTNPARLFGIREVKDNYALVDTTESYIFKNEMMYSRCCWTPFDGRRVTARVRGVWLRGRQVFDGENVLVNPGFGKEVIYSR